ncbi:hypothetical protein N7466_000308 [Penicillium verhagenii]|uniref:uncharacterized protein n=1 Tax=Penicillium verhagenii TaxID=1562060 RepID=UPI002545B049|nr:uncharacterized protein N7466_000308 [Penicillium verhagenii]KAJ5947293.1 hypothetical protein N7466_000308 [Penicillium verhagenii]
MTVTFQPYTPATSLGDELAIIFAFSAAMVGTMIIYVFFWRIRQKQNHEEDLVRRRALQVRTASRAETFNFDLQLGNMATVTAGGGSVADSWDLGSVVASSSGAAGVHEKMMDRDRDQFATPENRVELPVHGMEFVRGGKFVGS